MAAAKALLQPHWIAVLYMALHAPAEALKWLEIATEERCSWILFAREDPKFADFRSEIRFQHVVDATPEISAGLYDEFFPAPEPAECH